MKQVPIPVLRTSGFVALRPALRSEWLRRVTSLPHAAFLSSWTLGLMHAIKHRTKDQTTLSKSLSEEKKGLATPSDPTELALRVTPARKPPTSTVEEGSPFTRS